MKPIRILKARTSDAYSPNQILLAFLLASALAALFSASSLWIPASRIPNLHIRAIALSIADSISALSAEAGIDGFIPNARERFLAFTSLNEQTEWDTRYFNRRSGTGISASSSALIPAASPAAVPDAADVATLPEASLPDPAIAAAGIDLSSSGVPAAVADVDTGALSPETTIPDTPAAATVTYSSAAHAGDIHSSTNPLRLYMFGDSQVYSLGNGLSRLAGKDSPVTVEFLAVHSSGFIRGDYYNWPAKLTDTLSAASYDTAVMMLGMNDYQNFWNNRGEIMKKHTSEWEAAYGEKCASLIDTALLYVPKLYWIGMPRVKDPQYDESLRYIDGVQDRIAARYGPDIVIRCPIADCLPGSEGAYLANVTLPEGKTIQAMSSDGSHFTVEGGQFAMSGLFKRLSSDWLFSEIPIEHLPE